VLLPIIAALPIALLCSLPCSDLLVVVWAMALS
jgi:hypothetical protein